MRTTTCSGISAILLATAALMGCGAPPQEGCTELFGALAARYDACGIAFVRVQSEEIGASCAALARRAEDKTITYDAGAVGDCKSELAAAPCDDDLLLRFSDCARRIFAGTRADGNECTHALQCTSGSCTAAADTCPGVCRAVGGVGASCGATAECQPSLYCNRTGGATTGACAARLGAGQKCGIGSAPCGSNLFCDGAVCQTKRGDSGACLLGQECQATHHCVGADILRNKPGVCTAWKRAGASCAADGECEQGLLCEAATCQVVIKELGQPCAKLSGHTRSATCASGSCSNTTSVCTANIPAGGKCALGDNCAPGSECLNAVCTVNACTG